MEAAIMLALFLGLGWLIDRWLGTTPWFMIGLVVLGSVGLFISMKARYMARMEELEQQRRENSTRHRHDAPVGLTLSDVDAAIDKSIDTGRTSRTGTAHS